MMMQHKTMIGQQIAIGSGERFEERMRRIAMENRPAAALRTNSDSPWVTLRVDTGREISVKNALDAEAIECLVPMRKGPELRRRHRVIPPSPMPVILGYVLVRCHKSERAMLGLKSFENVRDALGGWLKPVFTDAEKVKRFNDLANEGYYDWERPVTVFKRGMKVRVNDSPFADLEGVIISCRADGKGDAVVEFPGASFVRPITTPLALLEKL